MHRPISWKLAIVGGPPMVMALVGTSYETKTCCASQAGPQACSIARIPGAQTIGLQSPPLEVWSAAHGTQVRWMITQLCPPYCDGVPVMVTTGLSVGGQVLSGTQ